MAKFQNLFVDPDMDNIQSERLHTPILDFIGLDSVILEWDEEVVYDGNPFFGSVASVVLIQDNGDGIPNTADTVLNSPDKFADTFAPYLPYDQLAGGGFSGGDDPIFGHRFRDISAEAAGRDDLYVAFQFVTTDTDFWAIDNVQITTDVSPDSFTWVGGTDGDWSDPNNWSPNTGPPGEGDIAIIDSNGNTLVTVSGDEMASETIISAGELLVESGASLTSLITLMGGTITGDGSVVGNVLFNGGVIAPGGSQTPLGGESVVPEPHTWGLVLGALAMVLGRPSRK